MRASYPRDQGNSLKNRGFGKTVIYENFISKGPRK